MSRRRAWGATAVLLVVVWLGCAGSFAQAPTPPESPPSSAIALPGAKPSGEEATLTVANRPIITLRAALLGRRPADRVAAASRTLEELVGCRRARSEPGEQQRGSSGAAGRAEGLPRQTKAGTGSVSGRTASCR